MPNIKSAIKRARQSEKRRFRNKRRKTALKAAVKEMRGYLEAGEVEKARALLPEFMKVVDKTAARGTIHPNKASRMKSRIMRRLSRLEGPEETGAETEA